MSEMRSLTQLQARALRAVCDRILPSGPEGPGAKDAHVLDYIDGQLDGPWGRGARMYRDEPFPVPLDEGHGWQLRLTPAGVYAHGLNALDQYVEGRYGLQFADLPVEQQDEVIGLWADGGIGSFDPVDGRVFFDMVRANISEGLFSDPCYGGNYEMVGWRWLGFPGVAAAHGADFGSYIERYDEVYPHEPQSLNCVPGD